MKICYSGEYLMNVQVGLPVVCRRVEFSVNFTIITWMNLENPMSTMLKLLVLFLVFVALLAVPSKSNAQGSGRSIYPQSLPDPGLKTNQKTPLEIEVDLVQTEEIGLTEGSIRRICESRLREARIPLLPDSSSVPSNILYLNVDVSQDSITVAVAFAKLIVTTVGNKKFGHRATTWTENLAGLHRKSADIAQAGIRNALDQFVSEYLRANPDLVNGDENVGGGQ